jgi:hypothetical protein
MIDMAPFYQLNAQEELKQPIDKSLMASMQSKNAEEIKKLDEKLADAEENLGETEISDALIGKAEYLTKIGDKVFELDTRNILQTCIQPTPTTLLPMSSQYYLSPAIPSL